MNLLSLAVVFGLILLFGVGMTLLYLSGWIGIESTPERLIISKREHNRYDPPVTRAYSAPLAADWDRIRELEWTLDGRYHTGPDGHQLADDDPAAFTKECHVEAEWKAAAYARKNIDHDQQVANTRAGLPAAGPVNPCDVTPEDIRSMTLWEFQAFRQSIMDHETMLRYGGMFGG